MKMISNDNDKFNESLKILKTNSAHEWICKNTTTIYQCN